MATTIRTEFRTAAQPVHLDRTLERLTRLMDDAFRVPGTNFRVGLDAIVGLIPGVGDVVGWLASAYILAAAARQGVPRATLLRMTMNTAVDLVGGALPIVGDVFDAWWKSNRRNLTLMQQALERKKGVVRS